MRFSDLDETTKNLALMKAVEIIQERYDMNDIDCVVTEDSPEVKEFVEDQEYGIVELK